MLHIDSLKIGQRVRYKPDNPLVSKYGIPSGVVSSTPNTGGIGTVVGISTENGVFPIAVLLDGYKEYNVMFNELELEYYERKSHLPRWF